MDDFVHKSYLTQKVFLQFNERDEISVAKQDDDKLIDNRLMDREIDGNRKKLFSVLMISSVLEGKKTEVR